MPPRIRKPMLAKPLKREVPATVYRRRAKHPSPLDKECSDILTPGYGPRSGHESSDGGAA